MSILQQFHKGAVDFLVDYAVHKNVRAFFHRGARRLEFGGVNGHADLARVTLFDRRPHDRPEAVDRMIFVDDVPNLHEIGILRGEFAHEFARLLRVVDLNYGRVAQIELRPRYT